MGDKFIHFTIENYGSKAFGLAHKVKVIKTPESQITFGKNFVHSNDSMGSRIYYAVDEFSREYLLKEYRLNGPKLYRHTAGRAGLINRRTAALAGIHADMERVQQLGRSFGPLGVCINGSSEASSTKAYAVQRILKATLPSVMPKLRAVKGVSKLEVTCFVALQIARDVQRIHQAGIIHFDIKPENVCIQGSQFELIDFDISGSGTSAWVRGSTRQYAPPEQNPGGKAKPSADIFALGIVIGEFMQGNGTALLGNMQFTDPIRQVTCTENVTVASYLDYRSGRHDKIDKMTLDHFDAFNSNISSQSDEIFQLFSRMVHSNPELRPEIDDVVSALSQPPLQVELGKEACLRRVLEELSDKPLEFAPHRKALLASVESLKSTAKNFWRRA